MTLPPSQLLESLKQKQDDFKDFSNTALKTYRLFRQTLGEASTLSSEEIEEQVSSKVSVGARPLEPLANDINWHHPCHLEWSNREQSLGWVKSQLTDVATFAVDGSQLVSGFKLLEKSSVLL